MLITRFLSLSNIPLGTTQGIYNARSFASNNSYAALRSFRLMGLPNRGNGGSSPGRLRNAGLCHFALHVAENFFVGFFLLIFLQRHKTIMSRPERQERSVQTSSGRNLSPSRQEQIPARGASWQLSGLNREACDRGGCLSHGSHKTGRPLFLQKDIEKGVVNLNLAVVFDEAQLSEAIHKETHS